MYKLPNIRKLNVLTLLIAMTMIVSCAKEVESLSDDSLTEDPVPGDTTPPVSDSNPTPNQGIQVSQIKPSAYKWTSLVIGTDVYIDRSFTYETVPTDLQNSLLLQTKNVDKANTSNNFISFTVDQSIEMLIAHDDRISPKPTWLQSFVDTNRDISIGGATHSLWKKSISAGTITLGGNGGSSISSMYTVILNMAGAQPSPGTGTNVTPVAQADSVATNQNTSVNINITSNDSGLTDTPIVTTILAGPTNGTATVLSPSEIRYSPTNNFSGQDTFTYQITDASGDSDTAVVSVTVNSTVVPNVVPVAQADSATTNQDILVDINVTSNDLGLSDTPIVTSIFSGPNNGTATVLNPSTIRYTPTNNFSGQDAFTYQITDANGDSDTAVVTVTVNSTAVPDTAKPFANDDSSTATMGAMVNIDVTNNDTGLADTPITTSIISTASNGVAEIQTTDIIRYTPFTNFVGTDSFVYRIEDTNGDFATATVSITVTCATCATNTTLLVNWNQNPDSILGYKVFYAESTNSADATNLISTIPLSTSGFSATAPSISYDAWTQFRLNKGSSVCFVIRAYSAVGTSAASTGICQQIPL